LSRLLVHARVQAIDNGHLLRQPPLRKLYCVAAGKIVFQSSFVEKVTTEGSPDFVPPIERIATFDNDGTLWAEQPIYFQFAFMLDRVKALAPQHPEWKTKEPFASLLKGNMKGVLSAGDKGAVMMLGATHSGMTTDEFAKIVTDWITTAKHPKTGRPYIEMVYQPMIELLAYLRENGFKTFIVSGGGIEFMRPWTEKVYGIPPEQVVGSGGKLKFELRDGRPVLLKLPEVNFIDDKAGKPVGIQMHIGRRPIAAFGNSDGDQQMLEWTGAGIECAFLSSCASRRRGSGVGLRSQIPRRPARQSVGRGGRQRLDHRQHEGRHDRFLRRRVVPRRQWIIGAKRALRSRHKTGQDKS
jgi:hypothetical protein